MAAAAAPFSISISGIARDYADGWKAKHLMDTPLTPPPTHAKQNMLSQILTLDPH
jgi:hypothetical protein